MVINGFAGGNQAYVSIIRQNKAPLWYLRVNGAGLGADVPFTGSNANNRLFPS